MIPKMLSLGFWQITNDCLFSPGGGVNFIKQTTGVRKFYLENLTMECINLSKTISQNLCLFVIWPVMIPYVLFSAWEKAPQQWQIPGVRQMPIHHVVTRFYL